MGHHRPTSEMPFKWHFTGVPMMAQHRMLAPELCDFSGDRDKFCEETIYFCDFSGGGGPDPLSSPLDPPIICLIQEQHV